MPSSTFEEVNNDERNATDPDERSARRLARYGRRYRRDGRGAIAGQCRRYDWDGDDRGEPEYELWHVRTE
jgi:hypothetical protein